MGLKKDLKNEKIFVEIFVAFFLQVRSTSLKIGILQRSGGVNVAKRGRVLIDRQGRERRMKIGGGKGEGEGYCSLALWVGGFLLAWHGMAWHSMT